MIVIGRGRLLADEPTGELIRRRGGGRVLVHSPDAGQLAELLLGRGAGVERSGAGELVVTECDANLVGDLAHEHRLRLHELTTRAATIEDAYLDLTAGELEYAGHGRS